MLVELRVSGGSGRARREGDYPLGELSLAYDATWQDPNDVLIEADRIRRNRAADDVIREVERRQSAAKKKPSK
jgi:hypothetical protein